MVRSATLLLLASLFAGCTEPAPAGEKEEEEIDPTLDSDGDGLPDVIELGEWRSDPENPDTDGDGLIDGDEVNLYDSSPVEPDTDFDGLSDYDEVMVNMKREARLALAQPVRFLRLWLAPAQIGSFLRLCLPLTQLVKQILHTKIFVV